MIKGEIEGHEEEALEDEDLAYAVDLAKRIADGAIAHADLEEERQLAKDYVARAAEIYPAVRDYKPPPGKPHPEAISAAIAERLEELAHRDAQRQDEEYEEEYEE
jgi:hypothetical protein